MRIVAAHPMEVHEDLRGFDVSYTGIGPLAAAYWVEREGFHFCRGKDVVFLGSCGIFGKTSKTFLLFQPNKVFWLPTCERLELSSSIENSCPPTELSLASWEEFPFCDVICSPNISLTEKGSLPETDRVLVENLELYSLVPALRSASRLRALLVTTNQVGPLARQEWKSCSSEAYAYLGMKLKKLLQED